MLRQLWSISILLAFAVTMLVLPHYVTAQVQFHGALAAYYSYSVQQPPNHQRAYTTQPARNAEIAIDLAMLAASWKSMYVDVDIALQQGTWSDANYVGADEAWKIVNQATVRVKPDSMWSFGVGIGPSHLGQESAINAKNMLMSRSLIADYTPYYNAGFDATFAPNGQWKFSAIILNGWQQIVDVNDQLSLGTKIEWSPSDRTIFSWNTYVGNDEASGSPRRLRLHSNFYVDHQWSDDIRSVLLFDAGARRQSGSGPFESAYYLALKSSWQSTTWLRLGGRLEYMRDPKNILVMSSPESFNVLGASLGADVVVIPYTLIRFEARGFRATEDVFPSDNGYRPRDLFFTVGLSTYL